MSVERSKPKREPMKIQTRTTDAFSLIELMIVVIVIGIIAATIAPRIVGTTHDARVGSAQASVAELRSALERFYIHMDRYPTNEEGLNALVEPPAGSADQWRGPYIERLRLDPWGNPFQYRVPGSQNRAFDVWSRGADGVDGGEGKGADIW
jgi:general secretion pathway protein G